ncbi:MAG: hypothetical protein LUG51_10645 [Tannerellaceae bacterium]|nr:hypothetical protein [Tannerellaceae bacterium]
MATNPTTGPYKIVPYIHGITYYGFWPSKDDLHQVKRNSYFKVAITHVHGAGYPGPGDVVDPDVDPDDEGTRGRLTPIAISWSEDNKITQIGEDPEEDPSSGLNPDIKEWEDEDQNETLEGGDSNNKFN